MRSVFIDRSQFLSALIFLVGAGMAHANCTNFDSEFLCEDDVTFSTSGNLWGPGNQSPPDATIRLISDSWNVSGNANLSKGLSPFGTFGGALNAGTSGSFGVYFGIRGMTGGTVNVDYAARMRLTGPLPDKFRPGQEVRIVYSGFPLISSRVTTSGSLSAGNISMWSDLALDVTAGASVCFFGCAGAALPGINFNSLGAGGFPLPPGTSFEDGKARQLVFELPVGMGSVTAGPVRDKILQLAQGACPARQIEAKEFGRIHNKAGISGCVGLPGFPQNSGFAADLLTVVATRTDTFLDLDLDLDFWASKIRSVPPLAYSKKISKGSINLASAFIDGLDVDVNNKLSLRQTLAFKANPTLHLTFPFVINYTIFKRDTRILVKSGSASMISLESGQEVDFVAPDQVFDIQSSYSLANTFSNDSELIFEVGTVERILEGGFSLGSKLLGFSAFKICKPWPNFSCWHPGIYSPKIKFGLGPLKSFTQGIKTFRDSKMFDNNQPPWQLAGFPTPVGRTFSINPAFLPDLVIQGAPTTDIPEGTSITMSTFGSVDRDGGSFTPMLDIYRSSAYGRLAVKRLAAPPLEKETTFVFSLPDDGFFTIELWAFDQTFVPRDGGVKKASRRFPLRITNVAPTVTVSGGTGAEGDTINLPVSVSDPGVEDTQVVTVDWGDAAPIDSANLGAGGGSTTFQHVFADEGAYTVKVCATDDDSGQGCESVTLTISNQPPVIVSVANEQTISPVAGTGQLQLAFQFLVKYQDPGTLDSHSARLIWDEDGSEAALSIVEDPFGPPGNISGMTGRASGSAARVYSTPGVKTTQVCVVDDDSGETCMVGPQIIIAQADLAITGSASPAPAQIGDPLVLAYKVQNNGPETADNVTVSINLPEVAGAGDTVTGPADAGLERQLLPFDLSQQLPSFQFAAAIAVAGNTLAIGAAGADKNPATGDTNEGAVYLFQRVGDSWLPQTGVLRASDALSFDGFGAAIAVSQDETTIVVGAPSADRGSATFGNHGAVYIFRRQDNGTANDPTDDTWLEEAILASPVVAAFAQLGVSVAIDGDTVVAGAQSDDVGVSGDPGFLDTAGSAIIFERNAVSGTWGEVFRLREDVPEADRFFGRSVAIAGGKIAVVSGDSGDLVPIGQITIYEKAMGTWQSTQLLAGSSFGGFPGGFAGGGIAMQSNRLLVSSTADPSVSNFGHFHGFEHDGSQFVVNTQLPLVTTGGIVLDGDYAALGSSGKAADSSGNIVQTGFIQALSWDGSAWQSDGRLLPSKSSDRNFSFGKNNVALVGRTVIAGSSLSGQIGQTGMGVALVMQTCEERPVGRVLCGLGALQNGEEVGVTLVSRVGCSLTPGTVLDSTASVFADIVESTPADNLAAISSTTVLPAPNLCGVDQDAPRVEPNLSGTLGDNGWYRSDVGLSWKITDPDSAITTTTGCGATTLTTDSTGSNFICSATSSGGTAEKSISIKRDVTAPVINVNTTGTGGDNGWFVTPLTVSFNCTDTVSGIASCEPSVAQQFTTEGLAAPLIATATDLAGNSATKTQQIKIDLADPHISAVKTSANGEGWNNSDVTVVFSCSDGVSGIAQCTSMQVLAGEGAAQSVSGTARDKAGRVNTLVLSNISIDRAPPVISAAQIPTANGSGWQRQATQLSFTCSDALAGVALCPDPITFAGEGINQMSSVTAIDLADNVLVLNAGPVNIDMTEPGITASVAPAPNPDGLRQLPVTVNFTCNDSLSGIAQCPAPVILATAGIGQMVQAIAVDRAGNSKEIKLADIDAGVPVLTLLVNDQSVAEGAFINGNLARISAMAVADGNAIIDWGDGSTSEVALQPDGENGLINSSHAFADDGQYVATITQQLLRGAPLSASFTVSVSNQPPVFTSLNQARLNTVTQQITANFTVNSGQSLTLDLVYLDTGSADSHLGMLDWGDGNVEKDLLPSENPIAPPSPGSMSGSLLVSHAYQQVGRYAGQACIRDDELAQTCQAFTVTVAPQSELTAACSIDLGVPIVSATQISVPLQSTVNLSNGSVTGFSWQASEQVYSFDDAFSANPTLIIPLDGSAEYNLGISLLTTLTSSSGQSGECVAWACAIIKTDGTRSPCNLIVTASVAAGIPVPALNALGLILLSLLVLLAGRKLVGNQLEGKHR